MFGLEEPTPGLQTGIPSFTERERKVNYFKISFSLFLLLDQVIICVLYKPAINVSNKRIV